MKKTERKKTKLPQLRIVVAAVAVAILVTAGLTVKTVMDARKEFLGDGYLLVPSKEAEVTTDVNEQYYFSAGTSYREKFGQTISFKDTSSQKVTTDTKQFLHYLDGSLASFTKGVVMDLSEVGNDQATYYGISNKTTVLKDGTGYTMSYMGDNLQMNEFVWKIADDKYMIVTPQVTLHLSEGSEVTLPDYIQLQYVDGGIVRLVHQQGTYQTVADNAYLVTDSGVELDLMNKTFMVNGVEALSLDDMVIDSSANLKVDENEDEVKIPTFNVVNGKDGSDGDEGESGNDGNDGTAGESGQNGNGGADGDSGSNGYDGQEGNSGDWGYDGKDGGNGQNAEHAGSNDGIASIEQQQAPRVSLETDTYTVGPNSVLMNLKIDDPNSMLQSDLTWAIYNRNTMAEAAKGIIPRGVTSAAVSTSALQPDTEYVLVVSGSYATEINTYDSDFFTKVFSTETLGLRIEKVQVTEDTISIKTVMDEDSRVGSYSVALYDEAGNKISNISNIYTAGTDFTFNAATGLENGKRLDPDTIYTVRLTNLINKDSTSIGADVSKQITTLKTTPYYAGADNTKIEIEATKATATGSDRYQTISLNLDTSIQDPDSGITGYRYELYEVSAVGEDPTTAPAFVKEVQGMQTVTFNVDRNKSYVGRVVVLFEDNEKLVEIPSGYSSVTSLNQTDYPIVSFVSMKHTYDSIEGYIMVNDKQNMLLANVSKDYPLNVTLVSEAGNPISIPLYTEATAPDGSGVTGTDVKYYYFKQDGLRRNTKYSVSVSGPVNDTDKIWDNLKPEEKTICSQYYLAGVNIDTGAPATMVARYKMTDTAENLFTVQFGITAEAGNDAAYEVGNLEKVYFTLMTKSGEVIGNTATLVDEKEERHTSDFSGVYSKPGTEESDQKYNLQYILTDATFGAKGDSRIVAGGDFVIKINYGYDYTQNDTDYPDYTNEMDWKENSMRYEFKLETRHTALDPDNAIKVKEISNADAPDEHKESDINDDTTVGVTLTPDYRWDDVTSVTYYVYEVGALENEPVIGGTLNKGNWAINGTTIEPVAVKTVKYAPDGQPDVGMQISPWTVYFKDKTADSNTSNVDDEGKTIFERGKQYFVRYEVTTSGKLGDTAAGDKYPACVYAGVLDRDIPFYRSQVFALSRQVPVVQRYLYDTGTKSDGTTTQTWKYKITDPDNALLAASEGDISTNVKASVTEYADFESAATAAETGVAKDAASLVKLYVNEKLEASYKDISFSGLTDGRYYTVTIPYELYTGNSQSVVEEPVPVNAVSEINTEVLSDKIADVTHSQADRDYTVNGVMVKGVGTEAGLVDDYGYRIRLTLQGSDLFRVAALKVTLTAKNKDGVDTTVVYDPVEVTFADGKTGLGSAKNSYGYAYLDYAPIVKAGINSKDAKVKVEAYYTTYEAGTKSLEEYVGQADSDIFTASNKSAWALKAWNYQNNDDVLSFSSIYMKAGDNNGSLSGCQLVAENIGDALRVSTPGGSVFQPAMDANFNSTGFSEENGTLSLRYTLAALCTTEKSDAEKYSDVLFSLTKKLTMDQIGMQDKDNGSYYVVERLALKPLQIDIGNKSDDYAVANFHTGDGMPGIKYSANSSIGMRSAAVRFETKGQVPNGTDKGMYLYLYKTAGDTAIKLEKWKDAEDKYYYLPEGGTPTSGDDRKECIVDNGTDDKYGVAITLNDGDELNGTLEYEIRGLEPGTGYYVMVKAKDTTGELKELFDYQREKGGYHYSFTTTNEIQMVADAPTWIYNLYNNKMGKMQFAIKGSEGTGMRIYYKVYTRDGNAEIKWDDATGNKYVADKGYLIEPLGNKIKYYHSDKTLNNTVNICFNPGMLALNSQYNVVLTAYATDNDGNIIETTPIGTLTQTINTPNSLSSPRASIRVVPGKTTLAVTVVMNDNNKVIYGDNSTVDIYDKSGNKVEGKTFTVTAVSGKGTYSTTYTVDGLNEDSPYTVKLTAALDKDNDGSNDNNDYTTVVSTATVSSASASISTSYTDDGKLILTLRDKSNFDDVKTILYSIDSDNGATHYEGESVPVDSFGNSGGTLYYTTPFAPASGNTYSYTIQYYDAGGALLGTTTGYFSK